MDSSPPGSSVHGILAISFSHQRDTQKLLLLSELTVYPVLKVFHAYSCLHLAVHVHVLLKPGLENFERYFTSACEMSAIVW